MSVMTNKKRVLNILYNKGADRAVIFDLLRNDEAIEYYSGEKLTPSNAKRLVYKAVEKIIDATRPSIKIPQEEKEYFRLDGRKVIQQRWTTWGEQRKFSGVEEYKQHLKEKYLDDAMNEQSIENSVNETIRKHSEHVSNIGDTFLFWSISGVGLGLLHSEVGLDQFSYFLYDCPETISAALEAITWRSVRKLELLDKYTSSNPVKPEGIFLAEDIAFNGTTMFSPDYLRKEFFPRLRKVVDTCHKAGWKFMFHSDGNLMGILDDIVEAGVDVLNPIETAAGMDIKEIHRRYPELNMAGGIDVSTLLPFGTPQQVRDTAIKAIEDAEGKIMVGSSSEMHHRVPLKNVITLYETVVNYKY